ncbi:hypothetical protein SAMN05892883_4426 [Jatrophihabitans sp. GAS493]|nr:hypothetical protein SAMN05892883_4426 [Jatrophihabitans sp. GAS493]
MNATPFSNQHNTSTTPADRSSSEQHQPEGIPRLERHRGRTRACPRRRRIDRQRVAHRRHRRPQRGWARCDRSRSDHRDLGRIDPRRRRSAAASPNELLAAILDAASQPSTTAPGRDRRPPAMGPVVNQLQRLREIIDSAADVADLRRRLGAAASDRDATADGPRQLQWRGHRGGPAARQGLAGPQDVHHCDRRRHRRAGRLRSPQWSRAGGCHRGQLHNGFGLPPYRIGRPPIPRRRLPIQRRERRSGTRIRTGTRALTVRRKVTASAGLGHASGHPDRGASRPRQPGGDHLPRPRRRSTCSVRMRWICRCARPPPEPASSREEPGPNYSPRSGA